MVDEQKPEVIENADSKGLISDYFAPMQNQTTQSYIGYTPRTDPAVALQLIRNDPTVRAAVIKLVDKVIESQWRIQPIEDNKKSRVKALEQKLREVRFNKLLRKVLFNLVLYNNAFVEIRKRGEELSDLNLLESKYMRINAEPNGDVNFYFQLPGLIKKISPLSEPPKWGPQEVVHFKLDDFTTNIWSEFNVEALYETVCIKDYIRQWLNWFFKTNQLRPLIAVAGSNNVKMKEFLALLKSAQSNIDKPIPVEGEATVQALQDFSKQGQSVMDVMAWCDDQIRSLLQVPGIAVGKVEGTGRSDGSEQRDYLNTRVLSIQQTVAEDITFDLFPKIGFPKVEFVFGVSDETAVTRAFENVQMMRNSQFTNEAIEEYLEGQGIVFETDKVFMDPGELDQLSNKDLGTGNEGAKGNKSADAAPSRARQNSQDLSKANKKPQAKK